MMFLLLGPDTRSKAILDAESLPENPSLRMNVIFFILKDLQARITQSSECQTELASDIRSIKKYEKSCDGKITAIHIRLDELEAKTKSIDELRQSTCNTHTRLRRLMLCLTL